MMEVYVSDTTLTIPHHRPIDRTIPQASYKHTITKKREAKGKDGECVVRKVSKEEMEKLWK